MRTAVSGPPAAPGGCPVPVGSSVAVRAPASSANLGPGFDCLGLALDLRDRVTATVIDAVNGEFALEISVRGEAADEVPRDERHLVAVVLRAGLERFGVTVSGLRLECENVIPHSRGLGSSAAAIVSGVAAAAALASRVGPAPSLVEQVQLASEFEGHPDNAAAAVLGGAIVSAIDPPKSAGAQPRYLAHRISVHPAIRPYVFVPQEVSSTHATRAILPDTVPRADAVFNLSRAALMVTALTERPDLLFTASDDRLHQPYRASVMQPSADLVAALRNEGVAAMISGAGPTVLALVVGDEGEQAHARALAPGFVAAAGFTRLRPAIADGVDVEHLN